VAIAAAPAGERRYVLNGLADERMTLEHIFDY
jgi:hypothetical protein